MKKAAAVGGCSDIRSLGPCSRLGTLPRRDWVGLLQGRGLGTATIACIAFALAACQHAPEARVETVEVKVPVAVQPIKPEQVPAVPAPLPPRPNSLSAAADVLASKWCEAVAYIIRAAPLLSLSAGLPPAQAPDYPECDKK